MVEVIYYFTSQLKTQPWQTPLVPQQQRKADQGERDERTSDGPSSSNHTRLISVMEQINEIYIQSEPDST